jgi:dTDP-4-dehydrorhamnose reductase
VNILLFGKNGQVGWELQRSLAPLGRVIACDLDGPPELRADFSDSAALSALVQRLQPGLIVNAAAHTAVDQAESEPDLAHAINATAPGVLAQQAALLGVPLVHYSTDYVFDGSGSHARSEADTPAPLNVYGRTKLEGEARIRASGCAHLTLRTSWVYAARGGNFARTILRLACERSELRVINDQIGAPTGADLLADVTAHAVRRLLHDRSVSGTYHCVAAGHTSWHGYAVHLIEWARAQGQAITVPASAIMSITTRDYATAAQRPLNSRLDTRRFQQTFDLQLPPWQPGVERMLSEVLTA